MKKLALQGALLFAVLSFTQAIHAQEPPKETGTFKKPALVELVKLDRSISSTSAMQLRTTSSSGRFTRRLARFFSGQRQKLWCARTSL